MIMNNVISLGWDCQSAEIRYGVFGHTYDLGYKTCPFDLCVTDYKSLLECLSSNFDRSIFFNLFIDANGWIRNGYSMWFNHESPELSDNFEKLGESDYFIKNNFKNFKDRYEQRIENWNNYIENSDEILFIINNPLADPTHLRHILNNKYENLSFEIALISDPNFNLTFFKYYSIIC